MKIAQVIIHQGIFASSVPFDYICPQSLEDLELAGRRVHVTWGKRETEGIVIGSYQTENPAFKNMKMIQKVMDDEPVLSQTMIEWAKWMSEFYVCSLSSCLRPMIPALLNKKKNIYYQLTENGKEYVQNILLQNQIFTSLEQGAFLQKILEQPVKQKEMEEWLNREQIQFFIQENYITALSEYHAKENQKKGWVYTINSAIDGISQRIGARAQKQQALYQWIQERGEIPVEEAGRKYSLAVIHQLEKKQIIYKKIKEIVPVVPEWQLNQQQSEALGRIQYHLNKKQYAQLLLFGVTGSGKTEVYIRAVWQCLKQGRNAMLLVPEIALAQQAYHMLKNRIPHIALFHSGKSSGERYEAWRRVKDGEARVVIGARSALFAPLENIGLLIIDEEQESSYKSETMPCYHAVEMAEYRMKMEQGVLLLGTATPTMQSMKKVLEGEIEMLSMPNRVASSAEPLIYIENLRRQKDMFTPLLVQKIQERLIRGEQTILFVNRRGYSPRTVCMNCGDIQKCPHCSVALVYHQDDGRNHCHYCDYSVPVKNHCASCGSESLQFVGSGTQRLEEVCRKKFPQAAVARLDLDAASKKDYHEQLFKRLENKEIDILIGTQMLAKGLHVPDVSLVGVIDADAVLSLPDYRAEERAVQLFLQVAGRAGRADKQGEIVIQTFQPENPLFEYIFYKDYLAFTRKELAMRSQMKYPPYTHICRILLRSRDEKQGRRAVENLYARAFEWMADSEERTFTLMGPAPCVIYKIQDRYRHQLLIQSPERDLLVSVVHYLVRIEKQLKASGIRMEIDFNPVSDS